MNYTVSYGRYYWIWLQQNTVFGRMQKNELIKHVCVLSVLMWKGGNRRREEGKEGGREGWRKEPKNQGREPEVSKPLNDVWFGH